MRFLGLKLKFYPSHFFTKTLPIFLLGLNYIFYNALGYETFKEILRIVAIGLLILGRVIRKKRSIASSELFFAFVLIIEFIMNGTLVLNLMVCFIIGLVYSEDNFDLNLNHFFRIGVLLVAIMIFALIFGFANNTSYVSTMGRYRTTLGFENPNAASLFYSSVIYFFLLRKEDLKIRDIAVSFLAAYFIYFYTNSRTSFISLLIFFLVLLLQRIPSLIKILAKGCMYAIDLFFIVNLLSGFFINIFMRLDALLSFRISGFASMIGNAGIRGFLFGGTTLTVDSFYYMFLFEYGAMIYCIFALMVHSCMNNLYTYGKYREMAFMLAFFSIGLLESSIIRPEIISVPLVWILIFSNNQQLSLDGIHPSVKHGEDSIVGAR